MNYLKSFKQVDQAALSHLLLRVLCILIIEHACAQLVQQSSGTPAVAGNYVLASLFGLGLIVALFNRKTGFAIGIAAGIINILVKTVIVIAGHEHFPYYPIVWITQSALVAYFCAVAFMAARRDNNQ
ncbi:MAG: hypothetical protein ACYDGO_11445 [Smithellaceae bacterium]